MALKTDALAYSWNWGVAEPPRSHRIPGPHVELSATANDMVFRHDWMEFRGTIKYMLDASTRSMN